MLLYAVHPSLGHTAAEIAAGYGITGSEYIIVNGSDFPIGTYWHNYVNLYYPEDGVFHDIKQEIGDFGGAEYYDRLPPKQRKRYREWGYIR